MCVPYRPRKQRVEGVQPVVHVFLVVGLEEDSSMFCAHGKCVGSLRQKSRNILTDVCCTPETLI